MGITESFLILGIEPVKDERLIKNAYREKLVVTNPEDDPEGFKRLRAAFEAATAYAKRADDVTENASATGESLQGQDDEEKLAPTERWLKRVEAVYVNIQSRQDEDCWRELLEDDLFLSLEEEDDCRWKLLRFLMDHFRLPGHIWKLLDKKMGIVDGAHELKEAFPADFINYVVSRCERGEDFEFALFEGEPEAPYDLFIRYYDDCWQAIQEGNLKEAERFLEEAAGLHIYHPAMEVCRGNLLYAQDKKEEAVSFMRTLRSRHPKDAMVCFNTAEMLWKCNAKDEAAEIYQELKAENEKHYMANVRLTEWHYDAGRYAEAKKSAEKVLSVGADDSFMDILVKINAQLEEGLLAKWKKDRELESALELCWCYLQDGKTSRGIRLAKELKDYITPEKNMEYHGLLAKLYIEQADYEDAIRLSELWEELLKAQIPLDETEEAREKNKDRLKQAQMIRIQCYKMLGYADNANFAKAIDGISALETGTTKDINLWLEKAFIYMEMEEYEKSQELIERLVEEYQVYAAAATGIEVYRRQWEAGGVVQYARLCIEKFPAYIRAYEHLGRVYLDLDRKDLLKELLEIAEQNEVESPYLDAYRYQMDHEVPKVEELNHKLEIFEKDYQDKLEDGEKGCYEAGLPVINEYLYWYPGAYMLRRRASFYVAGQQLDKALEDYERALYEEPANPYILNGMSHVYKLMGDYEQALVYIKKAILYADKEDVGPLYYYMARIYMLLGNDDEALKGFKQYESVVKDSVGHAKYMAECLARLGKLDEAIAKLGEYYENENDRINSGYYRALAELYRMAGEYEKGLEAIMPWSQKIVKTALNPLAKLTKKNQIHNESLMDYMNCFAWYGLVCGKKKEALNSFAKQIQLGERQNGALSDDGLEDMIFASILLGENEIGAGYARKLRAYMDRMANSAVDEYLDRPKGRLTREFLANYYILPDEKLQEILDKEQGCAICGFCLMPLCKELEAMRILLLLKQGQIEEAKARLERNLEIQPYDEYLQAIDAVLKQATT